MSIDVQWQLPNPFIKKIEVKPEDTDRLGHTNNVCYLSWLESIAWEHMDYLNCGWQVNERTGKAMAITQTKMDYLASSYAGEALILGTWINESDFRFTSGRCFELFRISDGKLLLKAEMKFACIDLKKGRASKMSDELIQAHQQAIEAATTVT